MKDTPIYFGGKHERAPAKGVKDSDTHAHLFGTAQADGESERAPAPGAKVSDIPAQSSGKT